jgi:MFS family permease
MGQSIGAGLAFLLGGEVIAFIQATPTISYPVLGELAAWQRAFIYFGLPSLLLVPLLYLIQEPPRVHSAADLMQASGLASHLWSNRGLLAPLFVGASITTVMGYALFWLPEVFRRVWHWDMDLIGWTYGGGLAVFGPLGVITGGRLAELLYARSSVAGPLMAVVIAVIGFLVFASIAPFMPTGSLSMMCYMPALFFLSMASATTSSAVLHIAPPAIRAQISASYLLTITILGVLFGPTSVAMITDYVFIDESKIHYALSIVSLLVGVLSLICLVSVRHRYRDEALKYEM